METCFSGIQPSGELHIGNYLGAIRQWVTLQERYRCFYCVVDLHALTQEYERDDLSRRTLEMAADLIACGVDPERSVLFVQSTVPLHTELTWILNTITPFGELSRMTQFKDKADKQPENVNAGLFDYPVLMAADILVYRARHVPVGVDQLQHLELAREVVRKFQLRWGDCFPEPQGILSTTPKILGLDGQAKMSKSLGNTITLSEGDDSIRKKLATAATDPARVRRKDPGDPAKCNIATLHSFFSDEERLAWVRQGCTTADIGCLDCKKALADNMIAHLAPIRARKQELAASPGKLEAILHAGARRANEVAEETMVQVRKLVGLWS